MWSVTVAALLWFAAPAGAIPLESWDDKIPNAGTRFTVLSEFGGAAVLDKETQLVWEQAPSVTTHIWSNARVLCTSRATGDRKGWRLPSMPELASLVDPTVATPGPTLPPGHPFTNVQSANYWSATTRAGTLARAWNVDFSSGIVGNDDKTDAYNIWCVRGGMNADAY
jgi:hypothetical protein